MPINKLNKTHRLVITELLKGEKTIEEIAELVGKSRKTIYNWLNDPKFAEELKETEDNYRRTQKARLTSMVALALNTQKDIMLKSRNDKARADVSADVLDRTGYKDITEGEGGKDVGGIIILSEVND